MPEDINLSELEGAIANALSRGIPIEKAIISLVNAGYPEQEVRAAANKINPSVVSGIPGLRRIMPQQKIQPEYNPNNKNRRPIPVAFPQYQQPRTPQFPQQTQSQQPQPSVQPIPRKSKINIDKKTVILSSTLIVLILFLGFFIFFRVSIINSLGSLFG